MNKTVEIVQEWTKFEELHPSGSIDEFCRDYLRKKELSEVSDAGYEYNYSCRYALTKTINRLSRLWMFYTLQEMKPLGLTSFDEFLFLLTVQRSEDIRKKDLIYMHFIEISSGLLMIDRLIKKGLLDEKTDEQDKRSKLVAITEKGIAVVKDGHAALDRVYQELYGNMSENAMLICLEHLNPLLVTMAEKWIKIKKFQPVVKDV